MAELVSCPSSGSVASLQLGDHLCLPVGSDAERLHSTAELAELGLRCGGKVLVVADTETPAAMAAYLSARAPGAGDALASGQLEVRAARAFLLAGGVFDPERTMAGYLAQVDLAQEQGYPGLWIAADMAWSLPGPPDPGALLDYEAAANPAFGGHRVAGVCIYDRTRFCPALIEGACGAHPLTPGQAPLRFAWTTDPLGLALSGEVDLTNHNALTALLTALHRTPGHVTIDATGLRFADLRAADLLWGTCLTRGPGSTTVAGSSVVNRLLALTGQGRPDA
ncbi:MAG TPA: MEDS domain-containing protein [Pseudonocardiaceae bacterium]|jgi:anti-anti-sigma regulatory factor|nr:MEDS domain-containing protein [Pseudonocardiaceae bacterium]